MQVVLVLLQVLGMVYCWDTRGIVLGLWKVKGGEEGMFGSVMHLTFFALPFHLFLLLKTSRHSDKRQDIVVPIPIQDIVVIFAYRTVFVNQPLYKSTSVKNTIPTLQFLLLAMAPLQQPLYENNKNWHNKWRSDGL